MKLTLFEEKNDSIWIKIEAYLSDRDELIIYGHDSGKIVQKLKGQYDYEYYLTIGKDEIPNLFKQLEVENIQACFAWLQAEFSHEHAVSQLREKLNIWGIKNQFSVW